jgi:hypothetical protein
VPEEKEEEEEEGKEEVRGKEEVVRQGSRRGVIANPRRIPS